MDDILSSGDSTTFSFSPGTSASWTDPTFNVLWRNIVKCGLVRETTIERHPLKWWNERMSVMSAQKKHPSASSSYTPEKLT